MIVFLEVKDILESAIQHKKYHLQVFYRADETPANALNPAPAAA